MCVVAFKEKKVSLYSLEKKVEAAQAEERNEFLSYSLSLWFKRQEQTEAGTGRDAM